MDVIGQVAVGFYDGRPQFPPRLADVLEIIPRGGVVCVELKDPDDRAIRLVAALVRNYEATHENHRANIKFISFSADSLVKMKKLMPTHLCYLVVACLPVCSRGRLYRRAREAAALGLDGVDINADSRLVDGEFVRSCVGLGLRVMVWTCVIQYENAALWDAMRVAGVEAFTTDFPPEILTWVKHANTKH